MDSARWPYIDSYNQARDLLVDDQKPAQARAAMIRTLPLLENYHRAWDALVHFQREQINQELGNELAER